MKGYFLLSILFICFLVHPSTQQTDATADCTDTSPIVIFDESWGKGWSNLGSTANDASLYLAQQGRTSLFFDCISEGVLFFQSKLVIPADTYSGFQFWVTGNGSAPANVAAVLLYADGSISEAIFLYPDILANNIQPYKWDRAVIPFSKFTSGLTAQVTGFALQSGSLEFEGTIYLDHIIVTPAKEMCIRSNMFIYQNGAINKRFVDESYLNAETTLKNDVVVYNGGYSLQWTAYKYNGLRFSYNYESSLPSKWDAFVFYIWTDKIVNWNISIALLSNGGVIGQLGLDNYYGSLFPAVVGEWTRVLIPFSQFGASGVDITGAQFFTMSKDVGLVYLADVGFVSEKSGAGIVVPSIVLTLVLLLSHYLF